MHAPEAHIDLRRLPLRGGETSTLLVEVTISPLLLGGHRYDVVVQRDEAEVAVRRVTGGYLVTLRVHASVYGPCYRCLREVVLAVEAEQQEFVPHDLRTRQAADDLSPFVEDHVVDVAGLAREAVVLALPDKILCSADCPGICPHCGADLREAACTCPPEEPDPRWDALRPLLAEPPAAEGPPSAAGPR